MISSDSRITTLSAKEYMGGKFPSLNYCSYPSRPFKITPHTTLESLVAEGVVTPRVFAVVSVKPFVPYCPKPSRGIVSLIFDFLIGPRESSQSFAQKPVTDVSPHEQQYFGQELILYDLTPPREHRSSSSQSYVTTDTCESAPLGNDIW